MYKLRYIGYRDNELVSDERIEAAGDICSVGIYNINGTWVCDYYMYAINMVKAVVVLLNNGILTESDGLKLLNKFEYTS